MSANTPEKNESGETPVPADMAANSSSNCAENTVPAAGPATAAAGATAKSDPLIPAYSEKQELERFLNRGHQTHSTIMLLTFFGVIIFFGAMLYWDSFDYYPNNSDGKWMPFTEDILHFDLKNQAEQDYAKYQPRSHAKGPVAARWPIMLYKKLRFDIYLIGGAVFLLALLMAKIEGAKAHRRELLVLRALLRESEKQRMIIEELEKKVKNCGK